MLVVLVYSLEGDTCTFVRISWRHWRICWELLFCSENTHPGSCHVSVHCWALPCCVESSSFRSNDVECVAGCIDLKLLLSVASCYLRLDLSSLFRMNQLCYIFVICTVCCGIVLAGEMTFELPDSVKQCFHEHIEKGVKCTLEYQVSNRPTWQHSTLCCYLHLSTRV